MQKRFLLSCLLPSSLLLASCVPVDLSGFTFVPPPVVQQVALITTGASPTPKLQFHSDQDGTISYGGPCSSANTTAKVGLNLVTFNPLPEGTYTTCTIAVTNATGKTSATITIASFQIDNTNFNARAVSNIVSTSDDTPDFIFSIEELGAAGAYTVSYSGACSSPSTTAAVGNNTKTFNLLAQGTYSNCQITVSDSVSGSFEIVAVPTFSVDKVAPVIAHVTPVPQPANTRTATYAFSSSETGTIFLTGGCASSTTTAVAGNNTIIFDRMDSGTFNGCTLTVKDAALNTSNIVNIPAFTVAKYIALNDTGVTLCGDYATASKTAGAINTFATITTPPNAPGQGYTAGTTNNNALTGTPGSGATASITVANTTSAVATFGTLTPGSLYLPASGTATYTDVPLTNVSGSGVGARANIDVTNGAVSSVTINPNGSGSGYAVGNALSAARANIGGGTTGAGFQILVGTLGSVNRITTVTITNPGSGYTTTTNLTNASYSGFLIRPATFGAYDNQIICSAVNATATLAGLELVDPKDVVPEGQDAFFGRDTLPSMTDTDGKAGFSYVKLNMAGEPLANQTSAWTFDGSLFDTGNETDGTKWSCVKDNVTGLVWEVKTNNATPDARDKDYRYSWYNSSSPAKNTGGAAGTTDGTNTCLPTTNCDTEKYVNQINSSVDTPVALCGFMDWRLPTPTELSTLRLLDRINPSIDANFIPNTFSGIYWSSSPDAAATANAWTVNFSTGVHALTAKNSTATAVRLVRGGF